jgi:hypothetical protein
MSRSKVVAILIWLLALVAPLLPPPQHQPPLPLPFPKPLLLFPVVFFTVASFFGGYPFSGGRFRTWLDKTWGEGTYIGFIRDLKPMLLFGVGTLLGSVACSLHAYREGAPIDAYWSCGFGLSASVGFLLARLVLAKRGLLMESRSPSAWRAQSVLSPTAGGLGRLLPASIRELRATNLTAAVAGALLVAGPWVVAGLASYFWDPASSTYRSVAQGAQLLFFIVLVPFFVLGWQNEKGHWPEEMGRALVRGLCCMLGAASAGVLSELLRELFR